MKPFKTWSLLALLVLLFTACKKDSDSTPAYPKTAAVEYRISVVSGALSSLSSVSFTNSSGGNTSLTEVALPFKQTFSRTVNRYDNLSMGFLVNLPSGSSLVGLKLEILVNGKVEKVQTFESNSTFTGSLVYLFP